MGRLPEHIQRRAREAYRRFKQVHATQPIYAARVGLGHRALAIIEGETVVWFWIGPHSEYDRLLRAL
jgi:hypothetical protein